MAAENAILVLAQEARKERYLREVANVMFLARGFRPSWRAIRAVVPDDAPSSVIAHLMRSLRTYRRVHGTWPNSITQMQHPRVFHAKRSSARSMTSSPP